MKIKQKGFTLIEVLISTTIFAFIAVISYSAINTVIKSQDIQKPHNENLIQLQKTLNYIERDITQTYNQSITLAKAGLIIKSLQNNKLLNISYHVSSEDQCRSKELDEKI
jgi:type II secretion system protein J